MVEKENFQCLLIFMLNQLMLESMDDLKRKFFSGNYAEKINKMHRVPPHDIYCESQNVSDHVLKEEQGKEVEVKENKKKRFTANYNMFF